MKMDKEMGSILGPELKIDGNVRLMEVYLFMVL